MGSTRAKAQAAPENVGLFRRRIDPLCSGIDIWVVLVGFRGEERIAELCRKEGINQNVY